MAAQPLGRTRSKFERRTQAQQPSPFGTTGIRVALLEPRDRASAFEAREDRLPKLTRLVKAHVEALHAKRTRLVCRVACQPHPSLPEALGDSALEARGT